jgi:hypothetical protein
LPAGATNGFAFGFESGIFFAQIFKAEFLVNLVAAGEGECERQGEGNPCVHGGNFRTNVIEYGECVAVLRAV